MMFVLNRRIGEADLTFTAPRRLNTLQQLLVGSKDVSARMDQLP